MPSQIPEFSIKQIKQMIDSKTVQLFAELDSDFFEKLKLANITESPEILDRLSIHKSPDIRCAVLENPNTSLKTLNKILDSEKSTSYYTLFHIQYHPNTNEDLILKCRAKELIYRLNR
jgi:hypothetical protein